MITIEQVLNDKGRDVATLDSGSPLADAANMLDEKRIGAVVVLTKQSAICGVLSERDIVRQVARNGADALNMPVADAMTRAVITAEPQEALEEGLARMTDRRIRHLPVVRNEQLVGLVSIGDLVKWKIAETEAEAEAMKNYIASG